MRKNDLSPSGANVFTQKTSETISKNTNSVKLQGVQKTPPPPPPPSFLSSPNLTPSQKKLSKIQDELLKKLKADQLATDIVHKRSSRKLTAERNSQEVMSTAELRQRRRVGLLDKDLKLNPSRVDGAETILSSDNKQSENKNEVSRILENFGNSLEKIKNFTSEQGITVPADAKIEDYAIAIIRQGLEDEEESDEEEDDEDNNSDNEEKSDPLKVEKGKAKENPEEKKITTNSVIFDSKNLTREPPEVRDLFEFLSGLESKTLIKKANEMSLHPNSFEADQNLILCMAQRLAKVTSTQWLVLAGQGEKLSSIIRPNCPHGEISKIAFQLIYQLHISFKSISQLILKSKNIMPWSLVKELTALNQSKTQEVKNDLLPILLKNIRGLAFISQNIQDICQLGERMVQVKKELEDFENFDTASPDKDLREELKRLELSLFKIKLKQNPGQVLELAKLMQIKMITMSKDDLVDRLISAMDEAKEFVQIETFENIPTRLLEWIEKIINNFGDLREIPHFFRNLIISMSSKKEIILGDYNLCINKWASDLIRRNPLDVWELAELYKHEVPYNLLNKEKIHRIILTKDLNNLRMAYQYLPTPRKKIVIGSEFQKEIEEKSEYGKVILKGSQEEIKKYPRVEITRLADTILKLRLDGIRACFSETEILELAQELSIKTPEADSSPLSKAIITTLIMAITQDIQERMEMHSQDEKDFKNLFKQAIKLNICKDQDFVYSSELAQNNSFYVLELIMVYISLLGAKEDLQEEFAFNFTYLINHPSDLDEFADLLKLSFNLSSIDQINRAGLACRVLFDLNANNLFEEENIQRFKKTGNEDSFEDPTIVLILNQLKKSAEALEEDDEDGEEEPKADEQKGQCKTEDENGDEEEDIIKELLQRIPSSLKKSAQLKENKYELKKENKGVTTKPKLLPRQLFMVTSSENINVKKIMDDYIKELFEIIQNYKNSVDIGLKSLVRKKKTTDRFMAIMGCQQNIREVFLGDMKIELKLMPILIRTEEIFTFFDHSPADLKNGSLNPHRKKLADLFSCYILKLINESQLTSEIKSFLVNNFSVINLLWQNAQLCCYFRKDRKVQELRRDLIVLASRHTGAAGNKIALTQTARKIWLETAQLFAHMHAKISLAFSQNLETAQKILMKMSEEIDIYDRDFKQGTTSERLKWAQCFTQCLKYFIPCSLLPKSIKNMLMKEMNSILKLVDPQFSTRNISGSKTLRDEFIQLIFNTVPFKDITVCASVAEIDFKTILFKIRQIATTTSSDQTRLITPRTPRSSPSPSHSSTVTNGISSPSS